MRILAVGDVCGSIGCEYVRKTLPTLKRKYKIDMVIINAENSADGNGITPKSADYLLNIGADVLTGGNHSLRRAEVYDYLDSNDCVLRPHNLPDAQNGKGYCLVDFGKIQVAVINLSGKIFLDRLNASCPFAAADELCDKAKQDGAKIIVVDFHAEATSEKRALGLYLDGKVSAFFGTHTHIQTADSQILENGTGYITDIGMTGPIDSVLGVKKEIIINRLKDNDMSKFELANGECMLNGCIFEVDEKTGKTVLIERIYI
ncbi:MAG: TIGR00282 family metallophosphoesterase [Ruminococcaceae bacterium]|nr:TIGR00282 family metallophosphoesterase [Oscillospiraceae bacterium]